MAAAQEELRRAILAVLPDLPADTLTTLMAGLEELGVENKEDMSLLSEENLLPFLRVVQCRKLLRAFSSQGNRRLGDSGCVVRFRDGGGRLHSVSIRTQGAFILCPP